MSMNDLMIRKSKLVGSVTIDHIPMWTRFRRQFVHGSEPKPLGEIQSSIKLARGSIIRIQSIPPILPRI